MSFMDRLKGFFGGDDSDKQVHGQGEAHDHSDHDHSDHDHSGHDHPPAPPVDPVGMPTSDAQEDRPA
jgi:hypothetical protein